MEESRMERWNSDIDIWEWRCFLCSPQAWRGLLAWVLNTYHETPSHCHDLGLHVLEWSRAYSGGEWDAECNSIHSRSSRTEADTFSTWHIWRCSWFYLSAGWSPVSYCSSVCEVVSGKQHWAAFLARKQPRSEPDRESVVPSQEGCGIKASQQQTGINWKHYQFVVPHHISRELKKPGGVNASKAVIASRGYPTRYWCHQDDFLRYYSEHILLSTNCF